MIQIARAPLYVLYADSAQESYRGRVLGRWRFAIWSRDSGDWIEASDWEPGIPAERLQLLTVIRGLEELDQPSEVRICTPSRYVVHGITIGLPEWRQTSWLWERYGELVPINNDDLWQRLDRAGSFHQIHCGPWDQNESFLESGPVQREQESESKLQIEPASRRPARSAGRWMRRIARIAASVVPM
jgi:ribonuclease HI